MSSVPAYTSSQQAHHDDWPSKSSTLEDKGIDYLDDLIKARDAESFRLKLLRNSRLPVSRLPLDVLINIFFLLKRISYEDDEVSDTGGEQDSKTESESHQGWDWLTLTWVCRHWRNAALGCRKLWAEIYSSHPDEISVYLERSGSVPLEVEFDVWNSDRFKISESFKNDMWRVRAFRITVEGKSGNWDWFIPFLLEMGQCVKLLALTHSTTYNPPSQYSSVRLVAPKRAYARSRAPKSALISVPDIIPDIQLESLSLDSVTMPWSSSLFHGLSELNLTHSYRFEATNRPSFLQLISILEHCPGLQHLSMDGISFLPEDSSNVTKDRKLDLTILRNIAISRMPFFACSDLLSVITFPADALLKISCSEYLFDFPISFHTDVLDKRMTCKTVDVELRGGDFILWSDPISLANDSTVLSSNTYISIRNPSYDYAGNPAEVVTAISALLRDPYWQMVNEVVISFQDALEIGNSWEVLLSGLPQYIKKLVVELRGSDYDKRECLVGLPEALSAFAVPEGGVTPAHRLSRDLVTERNRQNAPADAGRRLGTA